MGNFGGFFTSEAKLGQWSYRGKPANTHNVHILSSKTPSTTLDIVPTINNTEQDRIVYSPINGDYYSPYDGTCGYYTFIIYNEDYRIVLCHMKPIPNHFLKKGFIRRGDPIGIMSDEGNAKDNTPKHLHVRLMFNVNDYKNIVPSSRTKFDTWHTQNYQGNKIKYGSRNFNDNFTRDDFWKEYIANRTRNSTKIEKFGIPEPDTFTGLALLLLGAVLFFVIKE